jgi:hypothetical protein
MKSFLPVLVVVVLVAIVALPVPRLTVAASPKATPEMLKQLEGEFMKAAAEKGSQGYICTTPTTPSKSPMARP